MSISINGNGITSANIADGAITNADINSSAAIDGTKISGSFGKVLQVVSTTKTDSWTSSSTSFVDVTGLSISITPTSTTSKILVRVDSQIGGTADSNHTIQLYRTGLGAIGVGSSGGAVCRIYTTYKVDGYPLSYLDSPATTSSTEYKFQARAHTGTVTVNRRNSDTSFQVASTITLMEIGA